MATAEAFWVFANPYLARDGLDEGTMFGFRCVRLDGQFVAMATHPPGGMVVKLPAQRVATLVESGAGTPVAPSGRTFKEWVACSDEAMWADLFDEAIAFAGGTKA